MHVRVRHNGTTFVVDLSKNDNIRVLKAEVRSKWIVISHRKQI